ncbi:MAG: Holliday junction branch migration protein RuvA [Culicoidibacterales bacterium]
MIAHLRGIIEEVYSDSCIVDVNGVGYQLYLAKPYEYQKGQETFFNVYHHIREDVNSLYGFENVETRVLYMRLLSVKGVGPKVAMTILAATTTHTLIQAIETEDITYLRKIPGIGPKAAGQIILDLKGKLATQTAISVNENLKEAIEVLIALGYTKKEIDFAVKDISDTKLTIEVIVKMALKKIMG